MAYDYTSFDRRFIVEIELDAAFTLRVTRQGAHLTMTDTGDFYDARIINATSLRLSAGPLLEPRMVLPTMTLTFDNTVQEDGTRFQDYLDDYQWANKPMTLKVGQGDTSTDYEAIWNAVVVFPAGISITDTEVAVRFVDARQRDEVALPLNTFDLTTYPNMDTAYVGKPIPIVYGDWYSTAGFGEVLPCILIDSTVGLGGKWKIADHAIKSIEAVYKNGVSVAFTGDLNNGEFTLDVTYSAATDTITCNCRGATDDGTSAGTLLQTMPAVFNDILVTWCGVAAGGVNATALSDWEDALSTDDYVRRYIDGEVKSHNDLIAELLRDGFSDLTLEAGAYYPRYRIVAPGASLPTYQGDDLKYGPADTRDFAIEHDPEQAFANEAYGFYSFDPIAGDYTGRTSPLSVSDSAVEVFGARVRRILYFNWLYKADGAKARTDRELVVAGAIIEMVRLSIVGRAITEGPTDQFRLIYNKFTDADGSGGIPFQIRDIDHDLMRMTSAALALNMYGLSTGTWTEDDVVTWILATAEQRRIKGYWTDATGYADTTVPPDAASRFYKYL